MFIPTDTVNPKSSYQVAIYCHSNNIIHGDIIIKITYTLQQMICLSVVHQGLPTLPLRFLQPPHYSSALKAVGTK